MKFVVTGASGFVGRQLLQRLARKGDQVLSISRQAKDGHQSISYAQMSEAAAGYDRLLHLAVLNNDADASEDTYFKVNADLAKETAEDASKTDLPLFINFSSFHALSDGPETAYARSKRAGVDALKTVTGIKIVNLYLPAVYGDSFAGRLAALTKLPRVLRPFAFMVLSAFAPVVSIDRIVDFVSQDMSALPADEPVLLADPKEGNAVYWLGHKLIDYSFALSVLVLFWWLLFAVWVLVKMGSEGPGIFAQDRVGKGGRIFICYKFRTMGKDTRQAGTHEISESAVTPIGAFLRKTKIDELPQVWNILKGELSLIGPRPCLPVQEELVEERNKRGVMDVLPGITGLAQIRGIDMSDPVRLARKDAEYISRRGLLLDVKIVLATFLGKGQGDRTVN